MFKCTHLSLKAKVKDCLLDNDLIAYSFEQPLEASFIVFRCSFKYILDSFQAPIMDKRLQKIQSVRNGQYFYTRNNKQAPATYTILHTHDRFSGYRAETSARPPTLQRWIWTNIACQCYQLQALVMMFFLRSQDLHQSNLVLL